MTEKYLIEVSDAVVEWLGLMKPERWGDIAYISTLKGPRGTNRHRFSFARSSLYTAIDMAEEMIPNIKQSETHRRAHAVSRALRCFVAEGKALLGI